jgi:hypothetical protein
MSADSEFFFGAIFKGHCNIVAYRYAPCVGRRIDSDRTVGLLKKTRDLRVEDSLAALEFLEGEVVVPDVASNLGSFTFLRLRGTKLRPQSMKSMVQGLKSALSEIDSCIHKVSID